MKLRTYLRTGAVLGAALAAGIWAVTGAELRIEKTADGSRPIPVHMSGLSGEAASVLRFDLEVQGFEFVPESSAQYLIRGSSDQGVEVKVADRVSGRQILHKRYSGGSVRNQAHAAGDEVVQVLTGREGIGRTKIVYKKHVGKGSEIYVADYDGANAVAVTKDGSIVASPCWVPGSRQICYTSYKSSFPDIYWQDLATGNRKVIAKYTGSNISPEVSPDGKRVAMILSKSGSPDLYVANIDGSGLRQLTETKEDESSPCWSPDGRTICFVSRVSGRPALYKIPADGGKMERIRTSGVGSVTEPVWSPDGKWIAFTAMRGQFEICVVPAEGGLAESLGTGEDPSWAPNSRNLIFTRRVNHERILSLLDVPTKRVKDVRRNSGSASQADWAR